MANIRKPAVAGMFYEDSRSALLSQIEGCFNHRLGPGPFTMQVLQSGSCQSLIAPHAGYPFSGPCAAHAFSTVDAIPPFILLLGPSHTGSGTILSMSRWETPFGIVEPRSDVTREVANATGVPIDDDAHRDEHSLEVQLPFLQYVFEGNMPPIVPMMVSPDRDMGELGIALAKILSAQDTYPLVVVSSDFTHFGPRFGYVPFTDDVKENMYDLDHEALSYVTSLDIEGFRAFLDRTGATICGAYPIQVLLALHPGAKGDILSYYTSGDITGDYSSAVAYASVRFPLDPR